MRRKEGEEKEGGEDREEEEEEEQEGRGRGGGNRLPILHMNVLYLFTYFQGIANGMKANSTIDEMSSFGTLHSLEWQPLPTFRDNLSVPSSGVNST